MLMNEEDIVYEAKSHKNNTALCNTCSSGNFEKIDDLLFLGCDINEINKNGYTPLMCVFDDGNKNSDGYNWNRNIRNKLAYFLLQNGADATKVTPKGDNILNVAIKSQFNISPQLIEACIVAGADVDNRDSEGRTPLMNALAGDMKTSYYEVINTLIGNGAELDAKDNQGKTPLMYALENSKFIVAEKLIDFGASLTEVDNAGNTVLMYAMNLMGELDEKVVDKILSCDENINSVNVAGQSAVHMASQNGLMKLTDKLMRAGADILKKDSSERTPLMYALSNQQYEVAQYLIDYGAVIDDMDSNRNTVLMYAIHPKMENNLTFMKEIIEKSTNINDQNNLGHTALDMAIGAQSVHLIHQLIKQGATVDSKTLSTVIETENMPCIIEVFRDSLKKHSTYPQPMNINDMLDCRYTGLKEGTLLLTAISANKTKLVEKLLDAGVDANLICYGKSPLETAVMVNNPNIVDLLIQAGADVSQTNEEGNTPLMVALEQNKSKSIMTRLLREEKNIHYKNKKGISARKMLFQKKDKELLRLVSKQLSLMQKTHMRLMADNNRQNG